MKSEERHELQQNDLASWVYAIPILIKQYGSYLLLLAACGVLAIQLWRYYEIKQENKLQSAWNELAQASQDLTDNPPVKLHAIINTYDNRAVQAQAYLRLGRFYLDTVLAGNPPDGYHGVKISRDDALTEAAAALKKVITDYSDQSMAYAAALLNLGAVEESRHDWDAAKKDYEKLTDKIGPFAGTSFAEEAKNRLDNLGKYETPVVFGPAVTTAPASRPTIGVTSLPSFLQIPESK